MTCIYHHFISFPSGCGGVLQLFLQLLVSALWFHGLFPSGRIVSTLHVMRLCNAVGSSLLGTQGLLGNVFFFPSESCSHLLGDGGCIVACSGPC